MRLTLVDRILELEPGKQIRACKCLTMLEEYLQDHFPRFPVMPGVLMLEAMYQTAAWLVRATDNFEHSMVLMSEAKNIKYSDFVEPGQTLVLHAEFLKNEGRFVTLKCEGTVEDRTAVRGRLVLERFNLAETNPDDSIKDAIAKKKLREKFELLYPAQKTELIN
ncbi:MAG: beta-hydroxyacyl-ACP dehydratase [Planctomycetales bacterium]|nr:beta-hydroxyacyl-ACP dehydratase [Planctomycetales bacterium]